MQKTMLFPGCLFVDDSNFAQNQVSDFKNKIYLTECSHLCVCMSQKLRLFIFSKKNEFSLMRHPSCKHCHRMKKKNRKKTDDCTEHRTHTHTEPSEGTHKKTLFFKLYALGDLNRPASQKERTRGSRHETHTIKYSLRAQTHTHARNRIQNKNNSNNKKKLDKQRRRQRQWRRRRRCRFFFSPLFRRCCCFSSYFSLSISLRIIQCGSHFVFVSLCPSCCLTDAVDVCKFSFFSLPLVRFCRYIDDAKK